MLFLRHNCDESSRAEDASLAQQAFSLVEPRGNLNPKPRPEVGSITLPRERLTLEAFRQAQSRFLCRIRLISSHSTELAS